MTPPDPGGGRRGIPQQFVHLGIVVGVVLAAILIVRFLLIPDSYLSADVHRASTIAHELSHDVTFAGVAVCIDCHEEVEDKRGKGYHKGVACETCHGPSAKHADDPENIKPPAPRDRKFCPTCHAYDASRPTGFPQINPVTHNPVKPCISCHDAHDPVPPEPPKECQACHGQIERTKSLSAHALLPCSTCHTATEEHRKSPRSSLPSKPDTRAFCGTCHGNGALQSDAPKVSMAEHGGPYLCWQCHYPHLPEGRQ